MLRRLQPAPFWDHLGAELLEVAEGEAAVRIPSRPEFGRSGNSGDGTLHGGLVASALDMAASCALLTVLLPEEGRATVDLTVHYLAPARAAIVATASVRRRGKRTAVIDVEATSEGTLVALGRATFAIT